jgi:hypothetical protein
MMRSQRSRRLVTLAAIVMVVASGAYAQRGFREGSGRFGGTPPRFRPPDDGDSRFAFCKLMYDSVRFEPSGIGWSTDYPYAGINLMIRLSELTKTDVSMDAEREPNHWVVRLTDPALFDCPFLMGTDVGTVGFSSAEVARLREYLLKGGFLWVDDFWGTAAWEQWRGQIAKVLPPSDYPIIDIPAEHPLLKSFVKVNKVPQVTNIRFWRSTRGSITSERGAETADVHFRGIVDKRGRVMVIMTHNTDIGDSWEREGEDPQFFYQFSPDGYALGIDVLVYAMTH